MARKHFDVVVLGVGLGTLFAAALLARRGFRVRVLGQGRLGARYEYQPAGLEPSHGPSIRLARRPFQLLCHGSPVLARFLVELAQGQTLRRAVRFCDPMFQAYFPENRLDVAPDAERFREEIRREFPEIESEVDALYTYLTQVNEKVDGAFGSDLRVPPLTFWERRKADVIEKALRAALPAEVGADLLGAFPEAHPYRDLAIVAAAFGSDYGAVLPPLALARLHGAWTRGAVHYEGGEEAIVAFLLERIRAHGGEVDLTERAVQLVTKDARVTHVVEDSGGEPVGCGHLILDGTLPELLDLATRFVPDRAELDEYPELLAPERRFVVSMEVKRAGLPENLAENAFLLPGPHEDAAPVWLQREPGSAPDTELLVAETFLPSAEVLRARRFVLSVVERHLPFIERHYVVVDSPHDGLPLWDFRADDGGTMRLTGPRYTYENHDPKAPFRRKREPRKRLRAIDERAAAQDDVCFTEVERSSLARGGGGRDPEPMRPRWIAEPPTPRPTLRLPFGLGSRRTPQPESDLGWAGLALQPLKTPLANAWLSGTAAFPTLGQEGDLLAAWTLCGRITASDSHKERIRKEFWSKLDIK